MQTTPQALLTGALLAGIDPGTQTGLAFYDAGAGRLTAVESLSFWEAAERLMVSAETLAVVVVEDARRVGLYARHDALRGRRRDAAARSVGMIDRDVVLWLDLCARLRGAGGGPLPVATVEPTRKKWDAETFARLTGYPGRTNEHGRDAARLVFGLSVRQALRLALVRQEPGSLAPCPPNPAPS